MGRELKEELKTFERPRPPTGCLIGKNPDGSWKTLQAKEYLRAMSAGIAAAMVKTASKHQKAQVALDIEEVTKQFALFSRSFYTSLRFLEQILLIPLRRLIDLLCNGCHTIIIVFEVCLCSESQ